MKKTFYSTCMGLSLLVTSFEGSCSAEKQLSYSSQLLVSWVGKLVEYKLVDRKTFLDSYEHGLSKARLFRYTAINGNYSNQEKERALRGLLRATVADLRSNSNLIPELLMDEWSRDLAQLEAHISLGTKEGYKSASLKMKGLIRQLEGIRQTIERKV